MEHAHCHVHTKCQAGRRRSGCGWGCKFSLCSIRGQIEVPSQQFKQVASAAKPKTRTHQLFCFSLSLLVFYLPWNPSRILLVTCLTDSCTDHCKVVSKQQLRVETVKNLSNLLSKKPKKVLGFWFLFQFKWKSKPFTLSSVETYFICIYSV